VGTVAVLCTGGTIASQAVPGGGSRASLPARALLDRVPVAQGIRAVGRDILQLNSFALTPEDMLGVLEEVRVALVDPELDAVVVTHGTDAMEETSFFVDLFLDDDRPVVFTGAQRTADAFDPDGPSNLRDAVAVAAHPQTRGLGVLVVFDGSVFAARGVRKVHTLASAAFGDSDAGALGGLAGGRVQLARRPIRCTPLDHAKLSVPLPRVDVVAVYPGSDGTAIDAFVAAGARGLVLEATGAGNATPAVAKAVARLAAQGTPVVISTRVPAGPVVPLYAGNGGGTDLVSAGALPAGRLRPGQARMLLIALLATGATAAEIHRAFTAR
jgi:L-asparaginase